MSTFEDGFAKAGSATAEQAYGPEKNTISGFTRRLFEKLDQITANISEIFAYETNDDMNDLVQPIQGSRFKVPQSIIKQDTLRMYNLEAPLFSRRRRGSASGDRRRPASAMSYAGGM